MAQQQLVAKRIERQEKAKVSHGSAVAYGEERVNGEREREGGERVKVYISEK